MILLCNEPYKQEKSVSLGWKICGSIPGSGKEFFCSPLPDRLWGPKNTFRHISGVKQQEWEADYLPPFGVPVENEWSYTAASPICCHGMYRNNLNFKNMSVIRLWMSGFTTSPEANCSSFLLLGIKGKVKGHHPTTSHEGPERE